MLEVIKPISQNETERFGCSLRQEYSIIETIHVWAFLLKNKLLDHYLLRILANQWSKYLKWLKQNE